MAITAALTNSFRLEALQGLHQAWHEYRLALYTDMASLDRATPAYTPVGEVPPRGNYRRGGVVLTGYVAQLFGDVACLDWDAPVWPVATITADGGLIYNATLPGKNSVAVVRFDQRATSTNGPFVVAFPPPSDRTSLIQWTDDPTSNGQ